MGNFGNDEYMAQVERSRWKIIKRRQAIAMREREAARAQMPVPLPGFKPSFQKRVALPRKRQEELAEMAANRTLLEFVEPPMF